MNDAPSPARRGRIGLIELSPRWPIISIALLALLAGYGSAVVVDPRVSSEKTTASSSRAPRWSSTGRCRSRSIGLDADTVDAIGDDTSPDYNELYADDSALSARSIRAALQAPSGRSTTSRSRLLDHRPRAGLRTSADGHRARITTPTEIETFVRDSQAESTTTGVSWTERIVTVVVRNPEATGDPELVSDLERVRPAAGLLGNDGG